MRLRLLLAVLAAVFALPAQAQLAGTYTVGGSAPSYPTIAAAVADLNAVGISAPVTFLIRPGTYDAQLTIFDFPRSGSPTDEVTFVRSHPLLAKPIWQATAASASANWVVFLKEAHHVTFEDIDFRAKAPSPTGRLIALTSNASDITVRGCVLTGHDAPGSDAGSLVWSDGTQTHDNLTFDKNTFDAGWRALDLPAPFGARPTGLAITANTFSAQQSEGVFIQGDGRIEGNALFDAPTSDINYHAIVTYGGPMSAMEILGNTIEVNTGSAGIDGINGTTLIANNLISLRASWFNGRGIYSAGGLVAHNTVRTIGLTSALLLPSGGTTATIAVHNNILIADGAGAAIKDENTSSILVSDNNLLYTTSGTLISWQGATYTTLAAWQAASGFDGGSISQNPTFADVGTAPWDLHLAGASVGDDALGVARLGDVLSDVDGDARPSFTYRGADEADTPLTPPAPFAVTGPAPLGALAHGDALSVRWTTLAGDIGPSDPVRVSVLCPGQAPFVRYASTANDGLAGFVLPASLGTHGSPTDQASGCTAEIALASDPSRAAVSAPFVLYPAADKIADVSTRAVDRLTSINPARYGLGDIVSWFWDETSVASTVDLSVVCEGRSEYVRYSATANDGVATAQLPLVFGAFETCRVEVTSSTDPDVFGRSGPFAVLDTPLPTLDLVAPVRDEAIVMGQTYTIEWTSEAVPAETTVRLALRDLTGGSPNRFVGATTNTGTFAWSVPSDLSATDEYRLAISARLEDGTVVVSSVNDLTFTGALAASASASSAAEAPPEALDVSAARPNPLRARAVVRVGLPEAGVVDVAVFDAVGRRVAVLASGEHSAGWHEYAVEGRDLAPGVYGIRALASGTVATRTITVVR